MGNSNPLAMLTSCNSSTLKYDQYQFIQKLSENKSLMKQKQSQQLAIIIQHTFPTQQQLNDYIKRYKNQSILIHQFYLNLFHMEIVSHLNLCSKHYKLYEYYEYQGHNLERQIEMRRQSRRYFNVKEIMSILCSCVLVMAYFCKNQILHYTLNPSDIVITQDGICKVVSSRISQYIFDFNEKRSFYYSPQTLKMFKQQSIVNGLTNKSGVFTLGISLLNMVHLRPMHHLYNYESYTINIELMNDEIHKIKDHTLQKILIKMLKVQTYERITFAELEDMLFEYICQHSGIERHYGQSHHYQEAQQYQIAKLEQSITKLHIQDGASSHNSTSKFSKRTLAPLIDSKNTYIPIRQSKMSKFSLPESKICHVQYQNPLKSCIEDAGDDEDTNSQCPVHQSLIDIPVLDEFENHFNTQFSKTQRSSRNILREKFIQSNENYRYQNSLKQLPSIKNQFKSQHQFSYHSNFDFSQQDKQNQQVPVYIDSSKKKKANQNPGRSQYISQVLPQGRYEGYKVNNERHGFGTFYYNQGGRYCGEWVSNRMQGRGVLYYGSGKIAYEGQWKDDRLDGYGTLYNELIGIATQENDYTHLQNIGDNWTKYEGTFKNDLKKGQGILYLSNGQSYLGMFQNDQPHGLGHFTNIKGQTIRGYWLMGALNIVQ